MKARVTAGTVNSAGGGLPRVDFPQASAAAKNGGGEGFDVEYRAALLPSRHHGLAAPGRLQVPAVRCGGPELAARGAGLSARVWATQQMLEHFPTFNNGKVGGLATTVVGKLPNAGPLSEFLGDAGRATPFFTKVGIGAGVIGTGLGGYHIYKDIAQHKGGDQLASDITGTAFSGSTVAFLVAPNPVTGGLVIVTGLAWGGAEAWQHREAIGHGLKKGGRFAGRRRGEGRGVCLEYEHPRHPL